MRVRSLLTVLLAIGMHVSLCTGGVFALGTSVADYLAYNQEEVTGPMSYGSIGYLSCETNARSSEEVGSVHIGGCGESSTCFSQASSILEERSYPYVFSVSEHTAPIAVNQPSIPNTPRASRFVLARAGPLHETAPFAAHTLLKLE